MVCSSKSPHPDCNFTCHPLHSFHLIASYDFLIYLSLSLFLPFFISAPISDDRQTTYTQELEKCANDNPQLIMCVVPNNNADRYSNIKKKCCVQHPVPTQVICQRTITPKGGNTRGLMSIATKVAIQMNCKLGGLAWMVDIPLKGKLIYPFRFCAHRGEVVRIRISNILILINRLFQ